MMGQVDTDRSTTKLQQPVLLPGIRIPLLPPSMRMLRSGAVKSRVPRQTLPVMLDNGIKEDESIVCAC